jgi:hypothetical protein
MQRQLAGFSGLSEPDGQNTTARIEVAAVKADRFSNPHPGHCQQADQCPVGRFPMWRAQCCGRGHQRDDVLLGIEIRRRSVRPPWQQVTGRHLGCRVEPAQVGRKGANHGKPGGHPVSIGACRQRRPGEGHLRGQVVFALCLEVGEELVKELLRPSKRVSEGATHGQVVGQGLTKRAHAASPGQGRAIVRRASRSTLA